MGQKRSKKSKYIGFSKIFNFFNLLIDIEVIKKNLIDFSIF